MNKALSFRALVLALLALIVIQAQQLDSPAQAQTGTLLVSAGGPYTGTTGVPITFTAQAYLSTGAPEAATYTWSFGDGASASGQTVFHAYALASTYTVSVTAVSFSGQTAAATTTATVSGAGGGFTVSAGGPYTGSTGVPVTFTAQAFTNGVATTASNYSWTFSDGGSASGPVVSRTFAVAGTYTATVTAVFAGGQSATASTTAQIGGGSGGLTITHGGPYNGSTGTPITMAAQAFLNGAPTNAVNYAWSFGDGATATGQVVNHTYLSPGNFTVIVTATSTTGLTTSVNTTAQVTGTSNVVVSAGGPYTGATGSAITMTGQVTVGGVATTASSYTWNFGDGTTGSGQTVSHVYATAGSYTITLSVTTSTGQTASATTTAQIGGGGTLTVTTGGPYTGSVGVAVSLSAQATLSNGVIPSATFSWSFGDGTTGSGQTTSHTYAAAGTYTVSVTATDATGQTGSTTTTVTISAGSTTEQVPLYTGCNNVSLTWQNGTAIATVAAAVSQAGMLESIWRFDNASKRFSAYSPMSGAPNDLLTVNRNEPVFICVRSAGTLTRPA